ncbi:hypothetical protein [Streptomyces chrestomyceticus]|uniref:hypothetical protein n=1 Tax=Streptomyces chrestomyceticus TaxID=68185 RepID=UPI0033D64224
MHAVATKPVDLICAWCGDEWTYDRPLGKRGPNPVTNPSHETCGVKRQNQNRAIKRQKERLGEKYQPWNIPPADKAENLTIEETAARADSMARPWWRSVRSADLAEGNVLHLWDEWRSDDLVHVETTVRYSNGADRRAVERWFLESRAARTGDYLGQTVSAKRALAVIGSARSWREAEKPRAVLCTRAPGAWMEPFVMGE